ncbi:MAG: outer membrane beta-barrel protein [Candidatus Korobacteraceae bacterium]
MRIWKLCWLALTLVLFVEATLAQDRHRWEISPFGGFETGDSFPVQSAFGPPGSFIPIGTTNTSTIDRLRVNSGLSYGTFIDYTILEDLQLEFMWTRNPTTYSQHDFVTGLYTEAYDSNIDQYQFGLLYPFRGSGFYREERKFVPFVAGGLGFTHESNDNGNADRTAFAFNLGGGVKYYLSKNFGLRGDIRYMPTYANSTPGYACDVFGNCFYVHSRNFENRANFSGGIIFRF